VRYIILNLAGGVDKARNFLLGRASKPTEYVGNTEASYTSERLRDSRAAVDEFLKELPARSGLQPENVLVMVDAIRPNMYTREGLKAANGSYFDLMRRYLMEQARTAGFEVIDMQPAFMQRHALDASRFEFSTDEHWNGTAHAVGAAAAAASAAFRRLFPSACRDLAREVGRVANP
jgi:hypothetical protein